MVLCPRQGTIQMTKITGVGPAGLDTRGDRRRIDGVTAHRFKEAVAGMRHVAIVTKAARGIRRMMRMFGEPRGVFGVTLKTRSVAVHVRGKLIIVAGVL